MLPVRELTSCSIWSGGGRAPPTVTANDCSTAREMNLEHSDEEMHGYRMCYCVKKVCGTTLHSKYQFG